MAPEIASGFIGAGSNLASGAINLAVQNAWLQRSEEWARQDATTAYNRQLDFWRMQNAYNTPAAQMKRYIDAGLNPNLIYGQQQGAIAPASVPQAASQAAGVPNLPQGMFDPVANALMNRSSNELKQAQVQDLLGLTPWRQAGIAKLTAETNRLSQLYNLDRLNEFSVNVQYEYYSDKDTRYQCTVIGPDGSEYTYDGTAYDDFRHMVVTSFRDHFDLTHEEAVAAERYWSAKVLSEEYGAESIKLNNSDMQAFLDVAAKYYQSLASSASAAAALDSLDLKFLRKFGGRASFQALTGLVNTTIDFAGSVIKASKPKEVKHILDGKKNN